MSDPLEITYEIKDGPRGVPWREYVPQASDEYQKLLREGAQELELQRFFERNPCFVPGARSPDDGSGHQPHPCALITQPDLSGFCQRKPDFMWLATDSAFWYPTFVEIEDPDKRLFKRTVVEPTAEFWQARNQLLQWRSWIENSANAQVFIQRFGIPERLHKRQMHPYMILIYGRRAESENDNEKVRHRAQLLAPTHERLMSFDGVNPDYETRYYITVKARSNGRFHAVAVPPTFGLGPANAADLLLIDGLEDAIARCDLMPVDRQQFLIERAQYWRDWARSSGTHASRHAICE